MSIIVVAYVLVGMYFGFYQIFLMQNTTPRMMDIIVMDTMREMKDEDYKPSPESIEFMIILSISLAYIIAWPIITVWSNKE